MTRDRDLLNEFFLDSGSDEILNVYRWARARWASPWAVLAGVLMRVVANTEPCVQLPAVIGGRASLNLIVGFTGRSAGGKGITETVARLAYPSEVIERPAGSGEGIAQLFSTAAKDEGPAVTRAIFTSPEIDKISGLMARQGSILGAEMKALAMGELLGQQNARADTTRIVPAHSYRCCWSIGIQPGNAAPLIADVTGGGPQRIWWVPVEDRTITRADQCADPAPLDTRLPLWRADSAGVVEITYADPDIAEQIIETHILRQRGESSDPWAGHALLLRCKIAAALALLHKRTVVVSRDWHRAGTLLILSDRTRAMVQAVVGDATRQRNAAKALATADRDEIVGDRKLLRTRQAAERWLARDGELSGTELRRKVKADLRPYFDAAIAELAAEEVIEIKKVERGVRYRLRGEETRCTTSTPVSPHLADGGPEGHGVHQNGAGGELSAVRSAPGCTGQN